MAAVPHSLMVFDLDACCWSPEMFELWGGGAPFKVVVGTPGEMVLSDVRGIKVRLLADVAACFSDLHARMGRNEPVVAAIASRSDEPSWARECLRTFLVAPGVSMADVVPEKLIEIYKGTKQRHFQALHKKTKVPYERMAFFDDDPSNISDVSQLGVHCFLTPRGVTTDIYQRGLAAAAVGDPHPDVFAPAGALHRASSSSNQ